ncbi:hypothetical protein ACLOJK_004218 [Asimina triloba]
MGWVCHGVELHCGLLLGGRRDRDRMAAWIVGADLPGMVLDRESARDGSSCLMPMDSAGADLVGFYFYPDLDLGTLPIVGWVASSRVTMAARICS